jgi:undecaprenyl-diphosphatase
MTLPQILILAVIQGACELLPVSSSAHVIIAEKLMGLDPSAPETTFLLVMLHTGTMLAVTVYFWSIWRREYFSSLRAFWGAAKMIASAAAATGVVGLTLLLLIERIALGDSNHAEVEQLFGSTRLIAAGLATVGVMMVVSGRRRTTRKAPGDGFLAALCIGAVQGLCLPFRGFSRSGATISTALLLGLDKLRAETFSFALAVVLTPPVVLREGYRLAKASGANTASATSFAQLTIPSLLGMLFSFLAGLVALRWLSRWLERSRWHWFGYYCLLAAAVVALIDPR